MKKTESEIPMQSGKIKLLLTVLLSTLGGLSVNAQLMFQKIYGDASTIYAASLEKTNDGGYIMTGLTYQPPTTGGDVLLIKTDINGDTLWTKTFGGTGLEQGNSVRQTNDGGYIVVGSTVSFGAGNNDVYLIKTNGSGNAAWTKTIGNVPAEYGYSVRQTADSGYIILATTNAVAGLNDIFLIRTDSAGTVIWTKIHSGTYYNDVYSFEPTNDGGYIISGRNAVGAGDYNFYLFKADSSGNNLWVKTYGGVTNDMAYAVQQTADSGYIMAGYTSSFGAGLEDVYVVKTDSVGDTLWTKTYGEVGYERGNAVKQTADGGYIITGSTTSFGTGGDAYLLRIDGSGTVLWSKNFGGPYGEIGKSLLIDNDGGYVIAGIYNDGSNASVYLVKTDSSGNSQCNTATNTTLANFAATQVANLVTTVSTNNPVVSVAASIVASVDSAHTLCSNVGISEYSPNENSISIFPNPTKDNFTININAEIKKAQIEIYNVMGEKIHTEIISAASSKEIYLRNISSGIYFVKVYNGQNQYTKKLIIERD